MRLALSPLTAGVGIFIQLQEAAFVMSVLSPW